MKKLFCDMCGEEIEYDERRHKLSCVLDDVSIGRPIEFMADLCEKCFISLRIKVVFGGEE